MKCIVAKPVLMSDDAMLIANGQEEMGIEASLKLLDLSPDASLDAAGQAYEHMQQLIDQYHQDSGGADPQARQADLELLSLAYEKVVAHISERSAPQTAGREAKPLLRVVSDQKTLADLDFPMDLSDLEAPPGITKACRCCPNRISRPSRRPCRSFRAG